MLLGSSLVLAMLAGLLLNALFRIGASRRLGTVWGPAEGAAALRGFLEDGGRLAGARAEAVGRAAMVLGEFAEAAPALLAEGGAVAVEARFDEVSIAVDALWPGHPLAGRTVLLSLDDDPDDPAIAAGLALRLMRHHADAVTTATLPDGRQRMRAMIDDR